MIQGALTLCQARPRWLVMLALIVLAVGCGSLPQQQSRLIMEPGDGPPPRPVDVTGVPDAVPQVEPLSRYGNPASYVVYDRRYQVLTSSAGYVERGIASWYGTKFHGRRTSSGEPYDMYAMTAAHTTLPLPTYAEVTNLANGRSIIVKINDRGPFKHNRLIDLSYAAAVRLGIKEQGTGMVEVRAIDPVAWHGNGRVAAAPDSSVVQTGLYLQIGAFSQMENAVRLRTRLEGTTRSGIHVVRAEDSVTPMYRVRIGPLEDVNEVDRVSRDLLAMGLVTHVVLD